MYQAVIGDEVLSLFKKKGGVIELLRCILSLVVPLAIVKASIELLRVLLVLHDLLCSNIGGVSSNQCVVPPIILWN